MKQIKLTKEQIALVDDEDFERVNQYRWCAIKPRHKYYAMRNAIVGGKSVCIYMHRFIVQPRNGMMIDHIDGDGLNNQKMNLRECTARENACNRGKQKTNTSGFKGVYRASKSATMIIERKKPWVAYIRIPVQTKNKKIHLGYFETPEQAARVYDEAAVKYFGTFANLNFPKERE